MAFDTLKSTRDADRGYVFTVVSIVLLVVALIVTTIRFFLEWRRGRLSTLQNTLVSCTVACLITQTVIGDLAVKNGFGHHVDAIAETGGNREKALFYFWVFQLIYKFSTSFTKLSMLALYLDIFTVKSKTRHVVRASFLFVTMGTLSFIFATVFQCTPISKSWSKKLPGHCIDNVAFRWSWASYDIVSDLWIWLLPIAKFLGLKQNVAQKMGLTGIFLLGLFTCVSSIVRMVGIEESTTSKDTTWSSMSAFVWSDVEAKTALICVCLPAFKTVLCSRGTGRNKSTGRSQGGDKSGYDLASISRGTKSGWAVNAAPVSDHESETGILAEERKIHITQEWTVDRDDPASSTVAANAPKACV